MSGNVMSVAYNQLNALYGISMGTSNKYDAHKRSELRSTYNSIVKSNKESPLYKIKEGANVKRFAIDIKEQAHTIKNVVASLSENGEGIESTFRKRIATSNDPKVVTAEYVGSGDTVITSENAGFTLEVQQLATPQVNTGHFLRRAGHDFKPGSYDFDLNTNTASYEFQFNVNDDDTNEEVLQKLRKLINNANIGLQAELISDERGTGKALQIESRQTGLGEGEDSQFEIISHRDKGSQDAMKLLGIDNISSPAENSSFLLNGTKLSSYSNTFTVNNMFSVTLNGVSQPGQAAMVGFKPSADAVADNIERLVSAYNGIINTANRYANAKESSGNLLSDVSRIAGRFAADFSEIGLTVEQDQSLSVDRAALTDSISTGNTLHTFDVLNRFRDALGQKADQASIDPMNYVSKVIVAYKHPNPEKNFATPYISSMYSGMLVDRFC
ncbi:MAG: flagellar filament capping protein FliD [bacterium]|nr:flagellar filament capping protein FliD [bacterium]MDY4099830.1 flagellar filament capping protein FliD [Lachnospiraceae bacterium]